MIEQVYTAKQGAYPRYGIHTSVFTVYTNASSSDRLWQSQRLRGESKMEWLVFTALNSPQVMILAIMSELDKIENTHFVAEDTLQKVVS